MTMVFILVFLQSLSVFADSNIGKLSPCQSENGFHDCTYVLNDQSIPVGFRLYDSNGKFDPTKPTIVYVPGGPVPISQKEQRTQLFPKDTQVLIVDTVGTSRSKDSLPDLNDLKPDALSKLFSSDKQATVVHDIIKNQNLSNYVIWGESNGVQISIRLIDKLQRDASMTIKPKAAFLDSGTGIRVSKDDDKVKSEKCSSLQGRQNRPTQPHPFEILDPNIKTYLGACYSEDELKNSAGLIDFIEEMKPQMEAHGAGFTADAIRNQVGCPPVGKINYTLWGWAMTCGMFDSATIKQNAPSCTGCTPDACTDKKDKELDVRNFKVGDTAILGIEAADDCTNWTTTMDFLMNHLCKTPGPNCIKAKSEYLNEQVIPHGGHVVSRSGNFEACSYGKPRDKIFSDLFNADLKATKQDIINCYSSTTPGSTASKTIILVPPGATK